ncbi:hypothetical protein [Sinomicrobium weinanense]|uniref:Uncharacterized protein n=1 Tax=Sinomicrobium weinanense TaxID=2842200 RepID=A0A926JR03_9FLAO|nr:hypothetical protein [Sinomicrobium weinanense]MBC9795651.1 hypothetical protein [Sinomicrobium weinanense]MBU3122820.1 hypothetical protein [Sinomicrobium weinanense]
MIIRFRKLLPFIIFLPVYGISQDKPMVKFGGALRFNYIYSSWKKEQKKQGGDFMYDMFRINAEASYKGIALNAEYRLYSDEFGGGVLKQGWLAYKFDEKNEIQVGLTQVPFGIQQYNSHNWFFNIGYYIGLEDDHDIGVKFIHQKEEGLNYQFAFFKNAESIAFGGASDVSHSRYSYDVASMDVDGDGEPDYRNKEVNQFNIKLNYKIARNDFKHQLGGYAQYGGLYNLDTEELGHHYGYGLFYELDYKAFNLKSEVLHYAKSPENPETENPDIFAMAAYGSPYLVAAKANLLSLAVAYTLPVSWGPVESLQFYNDFGYIHKIEKEFADSYMNVTGIGVAAGHLYTYIDFAAGKNHSWLGGNFKDDFARGIPDAKWEARFNINIGYYF